MKPSRTTRPVLLRRALVALVAVALLAAACGSDDDDGDAGAASSTTAASNGDVTPVDVPGVTDGEIRYAAFGTNSNNPLGTCVLDCYVDGIKAYFAYRNSEGGVHGRKMVLSEELDDELGKNKQRALEIVAANDVFGAFSATQIPSGWKDISDAGMPLYLWSIHADSNGMENAFGYIGATCAECTDRRLPYIAKLAKAKKIATVGYGISPNSKLCANGVAASIKKYGKDVGGVEVVYINDDLAFGLPNGVGPEVTAMKKAGVDLFSSCIDLNGMKTFAQEFERQGMGDVPMVHPNTYDQRFVAEAGDLFEGDYVWVLFRPFEASSGGTALETYKAWMKKTGSDITELSMYGWINADTAYRGLEAAGADFDRAKVIAATNEIEDYTAGGLIPPIDFGRQHLPPTEEDVATHGDDPRCTSVVQVVNGKFKVVGGTKDEPFLCWPGTTRDWSEPKPRSFK